MLSEYARIKPVCIARSIGARLLSHTVWRLAGPVYPTCHWVLMFLKMISHCILHFLDTLKINIFNMLISHFFYDLLLPFGGKDWLSFSYFSLDQSLGHNKILGNIDSSEYGGKPHRSLLDSVSPWTSDSWVLWTDFLSLWSIFLCNCEIIESLEIKEICHGMWYNFLFDETEQERLNDLLKALSQWEKMGMNPSCVDTCCFLSPQMNVTLDLYKR